MDPCSIDELVLGTVNTPHRRSTDAAGLAAALRRADPQLPQLHSLFSDVSIQLVVRFALKHGISFDELRSAYKSFLVNGGPPYPNFEKGIEGRKRLYDRTIEVFEEEKKAGRWLSHPLKVLGGRAPDEVWEDDPRLVTSILEKIAWGASS